MRAKMNELLARHTGQPVERIERDFDRDMWVSAPEAQKYGFIDQVIESPGSLLEEASRSLGIK